MKHTTKTLIAASALACSLPLAADNHEGGDDYMLAIHHVHVKVGDMPAFREGMKAYVECYAENGGEDGFSVWQALDGDRTGFHIVGRFDAWAEFGEEDPTDEKCWGNDEIRKGVFDHMSSWETMYAKRMPAWSGDASNYSIVKLHNFRVDEGSDFRALVGEITGYMSEAEYAHQGTWYDVQGGRYWDPDYFVVEHFENFAAMDADRQGAYGVVREAVGEERADQLWEDFGDTLEEEGGYWSFTLVRQGEMGYEPEED
ncbi:MAG: hypothetical protein R3323_10160 [Wenzhouxiangellaceae bacterium]|nr:hypothetical protein [Wenzhouxiangellaceae bacterium]